MSRLVDDVGDRLVRSGAEPTTATVAAVLTDLRVVVGAQDLVSLVDEVRADLVGAGPLDVLLADDAVTDVLVNGPDEVWVDRGDGLERAAVRFRDESAVRRVAQRLAAAAGRRLDLAQPTVDARLADATRLHAVLPPVSPGGTLLSLRVPRRRRFTLGELERTGTAAPAVADLLRRLVLARRSFLVTGGTGTGKTTVLAALLSEVPHTERVVLVEDVGELSPQHPHVLRLEARQPNVEGRGGVDLRSLVRAALRMRPDRLVVGEVRGAEVVELLAALNTGHEGGCSTVHASSVVQLPARVEALALAAGLGRAAAHSQLAAGVDAVVHLHRDRGGPRRVRAVGVLGSGPDGLVHVAEAVVVDASGRVREGPGASRLADLLGPGGPP